MKFVISSEVFNRVLKRLLSLSSSDKDSIVTFVADSGKLELFYSSKLEKTDSISLFHEPVTTIEQVGKGTASLYLNNLFTIKLPEFVSEEKFPHCKAIQFNFTQSLLNVCYSIKWNRSSKETVTKLNYPLLDKETKLEGYSELFNKDGEGLKIKADEFSQSINLCNFIKSDVTSKESNGVLLLTSQDNLLIVNTDSDTAIKYSVPLQKTLNEFKVTVSPAVLNAVRNFISDTDIVSLKKNKNQLCVEAIELLNNEGNEVEGQHRSMLVPTMGASYIINEPEEFFKSEAPLVCNLDVKPLIAILSALVQKANDLYKRVEFDFTFNNSLNLSTDVDKALALPASIETEYKFNVNGTFMLTAAQKILTLDLEAKVFYDESTSRITVSSPDDKLVFLIQGLSM